MGRGTLGRFTQQLRALGTQVLSIFLLCPSQCVGFVVRQLLSRGTEVVVLGETSKLNFPSRGGQSHLSETSLSECVSHTPSLLPAAPGTAVRHCNGHQSAMLPAAELWGTVSWHPQAFSPLKFKCTSSLPPCVPRVTGPCPNHCNRCKDRPIRTTLSS